MFLYLVQHAEPMPETEDPARPLSEKGRTEIRKVALHLSKLNIKVSRVLHSKKVRARQTAEVIAEFLKPSGGSEESDGLAPLDAPGVWADRLKYVTASVTENIVLVGHLPHLGRLASVLLCGDPGRNVISFRMGAVACLQRDEKGDWSLQWMVTPDLLV